MIETPQQYTQRMLTNAGTEDPLAVQAATPERIERLIAGVPDAALRQRPAPDKWSVGEIIAHLADGEIVGGFRMRLILGSPGVALTAYDQDSWVTTGHYDQRDPRQSLEIFKVMRQGNLALLRSLDPEQWSHHGMHSERGPESIEHIARMFAGHDVNHVSQIEAILAGRG